MSTARVIDYIRDGAPAVGGATILSMVREYVHDHWNGSFCAIACVALGFGAALMVRR